MGLRKQLESRGGVIQDLAERCAPDRRPGRDAGAVQGRRRRRERCLCALHVVETDVLLGRFEGGEDVQELALYW